MIVKLRNKQLSFLFQEADPYFEMGYMILNQANIAQMLPYRRTIQSGKEKLIFQAKEYELLSDVLPDLSQNEIIDLLYAMVFMVEKVEENGFLKKECIWFEYDNIFYDTIRKKPMFAVLPVNREVKRTDKRTWLESYNNAISMVAKPLAFNNHTKVLNIIDSLQTGQIGLDVALESINNLGSGNSGLLVDRAKKKEEKKLSLVYSVQDVRLSFNVNKKEFILGKNSDVSDGVINVSEAVSRKHCMIIKQGQKFFVQDLGSTNHTFVNGEFIPHFELMELVDNDILTLADMDFRVHIVTMCE